MPTARLLTVFQHAQRVGVPAQGGVTAGGVPVRVVCRQAPTPHPWTDRDLLKHNLRKLRLRAVKMEKNTGKVRQFWVCPSTGTTTLVKVARVQHKKFRPLVKLDECDRSSLTWIAFQLAKMNNFIC